MVGDLTEASVDTIPMVFTKNLDIATLGAVTEGNLTEGVNPFGKRGMVFVTKGGAGYVLDGTTINDQSFYVGDAANPVLRPNIPEASAPDLRRGPSDVRRLFYCIPAVSCGILNSGVCGLCNTLFDAILNGRHEAVAGTAPLGPRGRLALRNPS